MIRSGSGLTIGTLCLALLLLAGGSTLEADSTVRSLASTPTGEQPPSAPASSPGASPLPTVKGSEAPPAVEVPPLPEPAALPAGTPQQAAATLAGQILVGDSSAFLGALLSSRIPVVDDAGAPVEPDHPIGGIAMRPWEFFLAGELGKGDGGMLLSDLGDELADTDPALAGMPGGVLLLGDINAGASSTDPSVSFWSSLIVELGRQRSFGQDMTSINDPAQVELDWWQVELLLWRIANDVVRSSTAAASGRPSAVHAVARPPAARPGSLAAGPARPCSLTPGEDKVVSEVEETESRGVAGLIGYLEHLEVAGAGKLATAIEIAGVVTDFATFLATYLALTVKTELVNGEPLVRTKKERPQFGERRELQATVSFNVGNAEALNCYRTVFSSFGITFSVPPNGPIKGARTEWIGLDGFSVGSDRIVEFYGGDPTDVRTDDAGVARVGVEGRGQDQEIDDPAAPVKKQATVRVMVQIKDADPYQDLFDAVFTAIDIGGGPTGFLQVPLEMLYRSRLLAPTDYTFEVKDWQPGAWLLDIDHARFDASVQAGGLLQHASLEFQQIELIGSNGTVTGSGAVTVSEKLRTFGGGKQLCSYNRTYTTTVDVSGSEQEDQLVLQFVIPYNDQEPATWKCIKPLNPSPHAARFAPIWAEVLLDPRSTPPPPDVHLPVAGGTVVVSKHRETFGPAVDNINARFTLTVEQQ